MAVTYVNSISGNNMCCYFVECIQNNKYKSIKYKDFLTLCSPWDFHLVDGTSGIKIEYINKQISMMHFLISMMCLF